jgi:flagellar hook-length control protein FliK
VAKEFNLRENVFQQALGAIQEAGQGTSQIRIQLRPESLGRLDVSLSVEGGKLVARLVASTSEVRDVFAANLPQFKGALESQGLSVSQLSVAVRAETNAQGQGQRPWQDPLPTWNLPARESEAPQAVPSWAFSAPPAGGSGNFSALA